MITPLIWASAISLLIYFIYRYGTKNNDFFKKNGVSNAKPFFLLGHTGTIYYKKLSMGEWLSYIYSMHHKDKIFGIFDRRTPIYVIRDPDLIKKLTIKDFDYFQDHPKVLDANDDPILGNILTTMMGQKWRDMRSTLSPAFTGSKMRQMFELITECSDQMTKYFLNESRNNQMQILEMKDIFSRFSNDVIATCAFGIKVDSLQHKDNEFLKMGHEILNINTSQIFKFLILAIAPKLAKGFGLKLTSDKVSNFFRSLIIDTMAARTEQNIVRPDMINLLMQARKGNLKHEEEKMSDGFATVTESSIGKVENKNRKWNYDEMVAQCLLFFLAGFETTSSLLAFAANELALNTDVQDKLHEEIINVQEQLDGKALTYETIQSMRYMDMVISESLRKWPPAVFTNRTCIKDYEFEDGDMKFRMLKGEQFWIPMYAIHRDEKYFPNPEKFDPERFSEENVGNIVPGTYIPFGIGPRNCIGSRFALMQIKSILYHLLKDFTLEMCEKTVVPLEMGLLKAVSDKGIHLGLRAR